MKTAFFTTAALAFTTICTETVNAADFNHVDQLASRLRNQASRTAWEVHNNFRRIPQYRHLYSDVYEMYTTADHIHEILHEGADLGHLRADVESLDRLFHHVEESVREIRPVDQFYGHGWGHWHGSFGPTRNDLRSLCNLLEEMEETLHHLREDLQFAAVPVAPVAPVVNPVPYQFRFGNRKLGIAINIP